jgi:anti-sigma factor RsiW
MTTSCETVLGQLSDYVDGELSPAARAEVAEHVLACTACRGEERALRELVKSAARLPQSLSPDFDLWPAIAARIDRRTVRRRERRTFRPATLAAAAALLVALSSAVTWRIADRRRAEPLAVVGSLIPATQTTGGGELLDAEREYARAAGELLQVIHSRGAALQPETLLAVEQNMRAIDQALVSLRAALDADPTNAELTQLLAATHRRKLDALRRVVRLSRL